jgi:hypothetical protein
MYGRKYSHQPLVDNIHQTSIHCPRVSLRQIFNPADYHTLVFEGLQRLQNFTHFIRMTCTKLEGPERVQLFQHGWRFKHLIQGGIQTFQIVFFTDEAQFHLHGYTSNKNHHNTEWQNPHASAERQLYSTHRVWSEDLGDRIISPIFFIETATARCHFKLSIHFISFSKLTNNTMGSNKMGWQHITEISIMQMLHKFFSDDMFSWCSWLQ